MLIILLNLYFTIYLYILREIKSASWTHGRLTVSELHEEQLAAAFRLELDALTALAVAALVGPAVVVEALPMLGTVEWQWWAQ